MNSNKLDDMEKAVRAAERAAEGDSNDAEIDALWTAVRAMEDLLSSEHYVDIVFDGPPGVASGRFVEAEDPQGAGRKVGTWLKRDDGYWVLRISRADI